jgi:hypothetical protein
MHDVTLAVLSEEGNDQRVVLVHRQTFGGQRVILRRESFSEAVGWFEQSSVDISPNQVGQLKQALGLLPGAKVRPFGGPKLRSIGPELASDCG